MDITNETANKIIALAAEKYEDEGTVEVASPLGDETEIDLVSESEDNGAYVKAWVWVDFAGTPFDKEEEVE